MKESVPVEFTLIRFEHLNGARQFIFRSTARDSPTRTLVVSADLELARKCDVSVQSLPLICQQLLQSSESHLMDSGLYSLTEAHMCAATRAVREQNALRKKTSRKTEPVPTPDFSTIS